MNRCRWFKREVAQRANKQGKNKDIFRDDQGFTTLGMSVSLLLCLALVFTSAQVYRINSASAAIQDVADASALAAQTEVAEFMVVAQVCDAVVLSLSLASTVSTGVGIACLCTPVTASLSSGFIDAGRTFAQARSSFSKTAKTGLQAYQRALPFIATVRAALVAQSNSKQSGANYHALAVSFPLQGEDIEIVDTSEADQEFFDRVEEESDDVQELSEKAEEAAQEALCAKQQGFEADCGEAGTSDYCMYERASSLAGMTGFSNPRYSSVDTWSFSVALSRAQAYYKNRLSNELESVGGSIAEQGQSRVRRVFYQYACDELEKGYVHETDDSFEANFPVLPKNLKQMRYTTLYTKEAFPVTSNGSTLTMHAWVGCPNARGYSYLGSIKELETNEENFQTCSACEFMAESLGNVASATSSVKTGFEYHYLRVAQAAQAYQKARAELDPLTGEAKSTVQSLFDACEEYAKAAASARIEVSPPGRYGAIAVVFDTSSVETPSWQLAGGTHALGTRVAVAGASLMEDSSDDAGTVLSGIFDGMSNEAKQAAGPLSAAVSCWSGLLETYGSGQQALASTIEEMFAGIPLVSASGLGTWASNAFQETMELLGLQPAKLKALKPVIANTGAIATECNDTLSQTYSQIKSGAQQGAAALESMLSWSSETLYLANEGISFVGSSVEIGSFSPFGEEGPNFTLSVALPAQVQSTLDGVLESAAQGIQGAWQQMGGQALWQ